MQSDVLKSFRYGVDDSGVLQQVDFRNSLFILHIFLFRHLRKSCLYSISFAYDRRTPAKTSAFILLGKGSIETVE